ncbi:MAG: hypothetical protein WB810_02235 [Candidatus Cybelea sp.]
MFEKNVATFIAILSSSAILGACGGALSPASTQGLSAARDVRVTRRLPHDLVPRLGGHPGVPPRASVFANITESGVDALVRREGGGRKVDPYGLHPPAILEDGPFLPGVPYKCWKVRSAPPPAPPGTKIMCAGGPIHFVAGDGSLESDPSGQPDTYLSDFPCPLQGSPSFTTFDQATVHWVATRFYDDNSNLIEGIRPERYDGIIYNGVTGKSAHLFTNTIVTYLENPPDGMQDNEYNTYTNNDFAVSSDGTVLAKSRGILEFDPSFNIVYEVGRHPYDDYFLKGDVTGLAPVCAALQ